MWRKLLLVCGILILIGFNTCPQAPKTQLTHKTAIQILNQMFDLERQYHAIHGSYSGDVRELGVIVPDSAGYALSGGVNNFSQTVTYTIKDKATGDCWEMGSNGEVTYFHVSP